MAKVRDEKNQWTEDASTFTSEIKDRISSVLDLAEKMGFSNEDAFYLIVTEVNEQQLLRLLK